MRSFRSRSYFDNSASVDADPSTGSVPDDASASDADASGKGAELMIWRESKGREENISGNFIMMDFSSICAG